MGVFVAGRCDVLVVVMEFALRIAERQESWRYFEPHFKNHVSEGTWIITLLVTGGKCMLKKSKTLHNWKCYSIFEKYYTSSLSLL